jgi:type IX secretion system PorP/SprF family membrane protein
MKVKFIILFLFAGAMLKAQTLPQFSLRQQEMNLFNPAFTGSELLHRFQLHHRSQWVGFKGAPRTQLLSYSGNYFKLVGLGGYVFYDEVGPSKNYGVNFSYAYHLNLLKSTVAFGLSATIGQYSYNTNELDFQDDTDPLVADRNKIKSKITPDFTGGILWYSQRYFVGLSFNYNLGSKAQNDVNFDIPSTQHYYLLAGYSLKLFDDIILLTPNILTIINSDSKYQFDAGLRAEFYNTLLFSTTYRTDKSVVFSLGLKFAQKFEFHYAYDFTYGNVGEYYKSSHEIILAYKFKKVNQSMLRNESTPKKRKYYWQ